MSKLRIGIDCRMYSSNFTGIGRYVHELVKHLQLIDDKNEYFLFFNTPQYTESQITAPNFHKVLVDAPYYSLPEQTKFLRILYSYNLDLMHFTHFNAPILYQRPSIVTIHDLTLHFFPGQKMKAFWQRLAYEWTIKNVTKKARKIIAVSANTKQDLEKILHLPPSRIEVIYEGIGQEFKPQTDPDKIARTKEKYQITQPFLLYTGVWRDHKNLQGLLHAFKSLRETYQSPLQLVITGKTQNPYSEEIFAAAAPLTSTNHILFPGHLPEEDLITLLSAAAAYVFPSFYEGFGLPPLEAMACGTPAVVSNTSCIPEICDKAAIYFDPYDSDDMAQKIHQILTDEPLRERQIALGLKHVQQFSWSKMCRQIHQLYLECLLKT